MNASSLAERKRSWFMPYYVSAESAFGVYRHSSPRNRSGFLESDGIKTLDLPPKGDLADIAHRLESAMKSGNVREVRSAYSIFLASASNFYEIPTCGVRV